MWSFFQYRQLRKQVERDWRARSSAHQRHISRPLQAQCKQSLNPHIESDGSSTQIGPTPDLEEEKAESRHEPAADGLVLVECASEDDQLNPRNWPVVQRIKVMVILCLLVFVQAWAGASNSLTNTRASKYYHVSPVAENLSTAMYLFGIGSGCFFTGPLSQTFGRNPVYLWFTFAYLFFVLGSALSTNFTSQIICRYFVGLSSSGTLGINGASLNDLFSPVELALWFPIIAWVNVARKCILELH